MTVQAFGALTSKNVHSAHRNQGIGSSIREQNRVNTQLATALTGGRRVGYNLGSRFQNDTAFANRFSSSDSSSSSSSFNWTAATTTGLTAGLSGAAAGWQMSGGSWIGAVVGGCIGLFGGGAAAGYSS